MKNCIKETNKEFVDGIKSIAVDREKVISFILTIGILLYLVAFIFGAGFVLSYYDVRPDSWTAGFALLGSVIWVVISIIYLCILSEKCTQNWKDKQ
jgi:hypothetical protein